MVVDVSGRAWRRTQSAAGVWSTEWESLEDAATPIVSGVALAGAIEEHFHVFGVGEFGELRHAEFDSGWTGRWENLGGVLSGTPAARMGQEGRIDVFALTPSGDVYQTYAVNDEWRGWFWSLSAGTSEPAVASWGHDRLDLFHRSNAGTLTRSVYESVWNETVDTGIATPAGNLISVATEVGHLEVLVTRPGSVWRATWPRVPERAE